MADRLSPCVLSQRFALGLFSDYISLPVCVRVRVCLCACIWTQLGGSFGVSASFEHFCLYCTVNHEDFIAVPELICVHTGTCLFIRWDYRRRLVDLCVYHRVLGLHVLSLVCLYLSEWICVFLTNLGRLHCTHQDISVEKWQCQWSDSCVCVCEDWWACAWQQPYCGAREKDGGVEGGKEGGVL